MSKDKNLLLLQGPSKRCRDLAPNVVAGLVLANLFDPDIPFERFPFGILQSSEPSALDLCGGHAIRAKSLVAKHGAVANEVDCNLSYCCLLSTGSLGPLFIPKAG